jgi:hypothetical protein
MRREGKPGGLLESVLVDPTGKDFIEPGQARKILNSRLTGLVRRLSNGYGVENSQEQSARSVKGRNDVVRRAAQKVVLSGYVARDHRDIRGPYLGAFFYNACLHLPMLFLANRLKET